MNDDVETYPSTQVESLSLYIYIYIYACFISSRYPSAGRTRATHASYLLFNNHGLVLPEPLSPAVDSNSPLTIKGAGLTPEAVLDKIPSEGNWTDKAKNLYVLGLLELLGLCADRTNNTHIYIYVYVYMYICI